MLWIKAFHIIFMVTWFSGLFYLPRLFVYHTESHDEKSNARFKIMERRLFYMITTPGGILTTIFGIWLFIYNASSYLQVGWIHIKLFLVCILWIFHIFCGYWLHKFKNDNNKHSQLFYRYINEVPTIILISIVILTVVKPF